MSAKKNDKKDNDVEILDFDDKPPVKKVIKRRKQKIGIKLGNIHISRLAIVFIFLGLITLISGIVVTTNMTKSNKGDNTKIDNSNEIKDIIENVEINVDNTNVDIPVALNKLIDINNYTYTNIVNVYTKNSDNSIYQITNKFSYNENKYKIEKKQTVQNIEYTSTNYYVKSDDGYLEYLNDLTSNTYTRNSIDENNYNSRRNINELLSYLIENNEITNKVGMIKDDREMIDITISTNKDVLNTLSMEDNNLNLDSTRLSIDKVSIDLYFIKDTLDLYEINFKIEDKSAYQNDIGSEIEYSTVSYTINNFNKVEDINLPY